jgi:SagB-type dehydrogenase family enzyme
MTINARTLTINARTFLVLAFIAAMVCLAGGAAEPGRSALPPPVTKGAMSLEEALAARRSVRQFAPTPLTIEQVGQLCWAAQGVTDPKRGLRTAPSAGATYPLELYVATTDGVRRYVPAGHTLERYRDKDIRSALQRAALGQGSVGEAPAVFILTAVTRRTEQKYGNRAQRYVDTEAGHAGQNILLQAVALGLGAVPVGAFDDADVAKALQLPADQTPLYLIPVGVKAK